MIVRLRATHFYILQASSSILVEKFGKIFCTDIYKEEDILIRALFSMSKKPYKTSDVNSISMVTEMNLAEFANSLDLDEVAHYEPPHLDLHCLPSSL